VVDLWTGESLGLDRDEDAAMGWVCVADAICGLEALSQCAGI